MNHIFDLDKTRSLPDIHHILMRRDAVLGRFGPLFRDPSRLEARDWLDFLSSSTIATGRDLGVWTGRCPW